MVVKRTDLHLYGDDTRARQLAYADNRVAELDLSWKMEQIAADFEPLDLGGWGFVSDEVPDFQPVGIDEQGRLDQKSPITCPHCGESFIPK